MQTPEADALADFYVDRMEFCRVTLVYFGQGFSLPCRGGLQHVTLPHGDKGDLSSMVANAAFTIFVFVFLLRLMTSPMIDHFGDIDDDTHGSLDARNSRRSPRGSAHQRHSAFA